MATETLKNNEYNRTFHIKEKDFNDLLDSDPIAVTPSPLIDHLIAQTEEERLLDARKFMEKRKHAR
ncbi:hypothetical protein [Sporolactobacillus nakayamae]|uniref:Uncharacterized protein n=1 Tax=Sporolactobacillus nakayamae TaxID=269670 RepID=A0A1I2U9D1_9BACL|nr:hypothetical protein [Sporolactobacillus nakayamae]SFG73722.1 hypothetical protein SAMN02982927_02615 [Sporolactobacillus nakayamae]